MNLSMWLTLSAVGGMAILIVPVARARHPLTPLLLLLLADVLVWNLAGTAHRLSDAPEWNWIARSAQALAPVPALGFVLGFAGLRRAWRRARIAASIYFGALALSSLSRFVTPHLFVGTTAWLWLTGGGHTAVTLLVGWVLADHHRRHRDRAERAHTRLLVLGAGSWMVLAATDLVHRRVEAVPQMSGVGMLCAVLLGSVVVERLRPAAAALGRWLKIYAAAFAAIAVVGNYLIVESLGASTALVLVLTATFTVLLLAAAREVTTIVAERRARLAELLLLGRYGAQMAHDLRNPLAALLGAVAHVREDQRRGSEPQPAMLDLVSAQALRIAAIVDDYARSGRVEPIPVRVDLHALVQEIVRPVELAGRGIAARASLAADLPPCLADRELVARALENLVQNAIEAMPSGGSLVVRAEPLGAGPLPSAVELSVEDSGPGIDARTRERVFDDFFTTKTTGSGLGLAFVRRVAEAHGGRVTLESELGRGTKVALRLPLAGRAAA
jgi:two-component system, NtrC family, sensor histidine kinase HydH